MFRRAVLDLWLGAKHATQLECMLTAHYYEEIDDNDVLWIENEETRACATNPTQDTFTAPQYSGLQ